MGTGNADKKMWHAAQTGEAPLAQKLPIDRKEDRPGNVGALDAGLCSSTRDGSDNMIRLL